MVLLSKRDTAGFGTARRPACPWYRKNGVGSDMKYAVVGAGGTGGGIGGFLARAGKDVTLIARGEHLARMRACGLRFETLEGTFTVPVRACTMEEYGETPDVIFVCVKGYSLPDAVSFIRRIAGPRTVVIPILNIYGTGGRLQKELPELAVTDGCIYIAAEIKEPGKIFMSGKIFRVVYGLRRNTPEEIAARVRPILKAVESDLADAGITPVFSQQIEKDALQKFSFVSPMAAMGACYDIPASAIQTEGDMREMFAKLVWEIKLLSDAMDVSLPGDIVETNLQIMDDLLPTATASMHRDIRAGRQSEVDGLVYQVVRLGEAYHVDLPIYGGLARKLRDMLGGE